MNTNAASASGLLAPGKSSRLALQLGALVLLGYWGVTIYRLGGLWSALPEYSYGWSVPLLCLMLFAERWRTRGEIKRPVRARKAVGVVCIAATAFLIARTAQEVLPRWRFAAWVIAISVAVLSWCLLWSAGGGRWVRHFFFPVAFFLIAVPWPDRFEFPFIQALTHLNAGITVEVMAFLKVAAVRMGNIILIEPGMVGVQEACSGIRSFQSTLMVSLFLGEMFRFSFWRRVVFVMSGAALAFGFNIVRTSFLVWSCNNEGLGAVEKFHDPAGWSIFAASFTGLLLAGWWLNRSQKRERERTVVSTGSKPVVAATMPVVSGVASSVFQPWLVVLLGLMFVSTELGVNWWFRANEKPRAATVDWATRFEEEGAPVKPLKIAKESQAMLNYDRGGGWEWQGGGGERWQAFHFTWDAPKTLMRRIACGSAATGHDPELCFTAAGMQLRKNHGKRRYVVNGVPLVFKEYEFVDRNVPIFVFSCIWERNAEQTTAEALEISGAPSTGRGLREAAARFKAGDRGITDEVRVFKLGVWGPRTIGEAETALQQQISALVEKR